MKSGPEESERKDDQAGRAAKGQAAISGSLGSGRAVAKPTDGRVYFECSHVG